MPAAETAAVSPLSASVSSALAEIAVYGLGEDWVETYRSRIHAVKSRKG